MPRAYPGVAGQIDHALQSEIHHRFTQSWGWAATFGSMPNAAHLLADFFEGSEVPGDNPRDVRTPTVNMHGGGRWQVNERAAGYLLEVERVLYGMHAAGEDVTTFFPSLGAWFEGVVAFKTPCGGTAQEGCEAVPQGHISLLRKLGGLIDSRGRLAVSEHVERSLADRLKDAEPLPLPRRAPMPVSVPRVSSC